MGIWQIGVFFHRNAPSSEISAIMFRISSTAHPLLFPTLLMIILYLVKDSNKYLALYLPSVLVIIYGQFQNVNFTMTDYGWSYILPELVLYLVIMLNIFYSIMCISVSYRIFNKYDSSLLRKKIIYLLIAFIGFQVILFLLTNAMIFSFPGFPPFGGIISILTVIVTAYGVSLKEEEKISVEEEPISQTIENWIALINKIQKVIPGQELGEDQITYENLLMKIIGERYIDEGDKVTYRPPPMDQAILKVTEFMEKNPWSLKAFPQYERLFLNIYESLKRHDKEALQEWLNIMITKHGGFLAKQGLLEKVSNDIELPKVYKKVNEKNIQIYSEQKPESIRDFITQAQEFKINCIYITKYNPKESFKNLDDNGISFIWVYSGKGDTILPTEINEINNEIKIDLNDTKVNCIAIDCVEILISANGIIKTLKFLNNLIQKSKQSDNMIILSINPKLLQKDHYDKISNLLEVR